MKKLLLLVLTFSVGVYVLSTNLFQEYHYMSTPKTWAEAQRYCREMYVDLATTDSPEENDRVLQKVQEPEKFDWIGLFYDMANWKWAMGDEDFNHEDFSNWKNEQGRSKYNLVETVMFCNDAKNYCRSHYTDLITVRRMSENDEIHPLIETNYWIGLHRALWANWSDLTPVHFTNWETGQPDNNGVTNMTSCAAVNTSAGTWWGVDCSEKHEFICQTLIASSWRLELRFQSEADLNDPDAQQQILQQLQEAWIRLIILYMLL